MLATGPPILFFFV